jgi:hypothetical protein
MDISKQVASLEQAKRLKELGVTADSYFRWVCGISEPKEDYILASEYSSKSVRRNEFPAYTVAELGEMLPKRYEAYWTESYNLGCGEWRCDLYKRVGDSHSEVELSKYGSTEAEARCAMLIHLIEQGIIKPEQINKKK